MRGALMIMVVVTLLIVGVLVIKNMGGVSSVGMTPSSAEQHLDRADMVTLLRI